MEKHRTQGLVIAFNWTTSSRETFVSCIFDFRRFPCVRVTLWQIGLYCSAFREVNPLCPFCPEAEKATGLVL